MRLIITLFLLVVATVVAVATDDHSSEVQPSLKSHEDKDPKEMTLNASQQDTTQSEAPQEHQEEKKETKPKKSGKLLKRVAIGLGVGVVVSIVVVVVVIAGALSLLNTF